MHQHPFRMGTPFLQLGLLFLILSVPANASVLKLQDYLNEVSTQNEGVRGAAMKSQGAQLRSKEGKLLITPTLFANMYFMDDAQPMQNPAFSGYKTIRKSYSFGISEQTTFGTRAALSYNINFNDTIGASPAFLPLPRFYDARPTLEVTQPLWRNLFGIETRAQQDLLEASGKGAEFAEMFRHKQLLLESKLAYLKLSLARETVSLQKQNLERARKIKAWSDERSKSHLADRADLLQAEAAYKVRELELQSAEDDEKAAARLFNFLRSVNSEKVEESVSALESISIEPPAKFSLREDVLASLEQEKAARANAVMGVQRDLPQLDLFGSISLNARNAELGQSMADSFEVRKRTYMVGVKLTAPLDLALAAQSREGFSREAEGAQLISQRKYYDTEKEFSSLKRDYQYAKHRYSLALSIEKAQKTKLEYERSRHVKGRSTTFQVLSFEQEYSISQMTRLRTQFEVLRIALQLKTYGSENLAGGI